MTRQFTVCSLAGTCLLSAALAVAQPPATPSSTAPAASQEPGADLLKQGQQRLREGKHEDALGLFRDAIAKTQPSSAAWASANVQAGIVLDLMGRYEEARGHFSKAIDATTKPEDKARAQRAMAMSYAFERNCDGAEKYEAPLYESYLAANDFYMAGEIANELARVCLESGNADKAETWYKRGYEAGLKEPNITPARRDLWEFRWEHARARIAARRGQAQEAQKHVAAARAAFDKGTNPEQAQFVPYLAGYVAFYGGDYHTAVTELQKGNQNDPFILSLLGQAHEKLGEKDKAAEYYRKVLGSNAHNPTGAFARPLAKERLGMK
ncbi:MAG TPA: tetratricopeptide repeat protein [Vicinamibacterales bacterium]|nr:tetratricopeptide repeat protein [Vicinamibacterales bacterium]